MNSRDKRAILADVKRLAAEYYKVAERPLGVTGELAEYEAAEKLGLELADARTEGFDATRGKDGRTEKIQIKGRRIAKGRSLYVGRVPKIDLNKEFDVVILVLMNADYEPVEMWEAPRHKVVKRLLEPGSKARNERYSMAISQFKSIATRVWPK